jgi:hypothetical protein
VGTKKKPVAAPKFTDLNTAEAVEHFRKVVAEFGKKHTRSRAAARKVLIETGIWDKSGRLTKTYRS